MINLSRQRLDISHEQARHSICDGADSLCWESESRCQLQQVQGFNTESGTIVYTVYGPDGGRCF